MAMKMAAMSASATASALTPPSSSHGNGYSWGSSSPDRTENHMQDQKYQTNHDHTHGPVRSPLLSQNGNSGPFSSQAEFEAPARRMASSDKLSGKETSYALQPHGQDARGAYAGDANGAFDSYPKNMSGAGAEGLKRSTADMYGDVADEDSSKWIHRDKLAKIESQELQAAGIILPKTRARSKPRREQSYERQGGGRRMTDASDQAAPRSRKNSVMTEPKVMDTAVPSWDLRLPEEIADESSNYWIPGGAPKGGSRIPVAKMSPAPIPADYIERDAPVPRKLNGSNEEDSISFPKTRSRSTSLNLDSQPVLQNGKRSVTDVSPKKGAGVGSRKLSTTAKAPAALGARPKTRGGPSGGSNNSGSTTTRPSTRSGELSPNNKKQMEGEPPWMISAYRPDPRLPPDQQLLPTVAKRLQQEKLEREGKFGSVYDREFRPLSDEGFLPRPEGPDKIESDEAETEKVDEWPLKQEGITRSPTLGKTNSYSTMPRIQDTANRSPLPSPRTPMQQQQQSHKMDDAVRPPDVPEEDEEKKEKGCGCCAVM